MRCLQCSAAILALLLTDPSDACSAAYNILEIGMLNNFGSSDAWDINDSGQVVGAWWPGSGGKRAFRYSNGTTTDLGTLGGGFAWARGINDSGQVVGASELLYNTIQHAFLYDNGTTTDLGTFGGNTSAAFAINNNGQAVGFANTTSDSRAFLYSNGTKTDLGTLTGYGSSRAYAVNNGGQVVGESVFYDGDTHRWRAFLHSGGAMQNLGVPPGTNTSIAQGINDLGQVVGYAFLDPAFSSQRAFLYSNGTMTNIGTLPGGANSRALDINNAGQVVGFANPAEASSNEDSHAILYSSATMSDLNASIASGAGWILNAATAINDSGWIVGYGKHYGFNRAFLLIPTAGRSESAPVAAGTQSVSMLAGSIGAATATMNVTQPGNLQVTYATPVANSAGGIQLPDYQLLFDAAQSFPTGSVLQQWNVDFSGDFSGDATLTLHYNDALLGPGVDESGLFLRHYDAATGQWETVLPASIDAQDNTLTFNAASFSPFVLSSPAAPVPEPSTLVLLGIGAIALAGGARRRMRVRWSVS